MEQFAEYSRIVQEPIFLSTIREKQYQPSQLFDALNDFQTVFRNATQFYKPDTVQYQTAQTLHAEFVKEISLRWGEPVSREYKNLRRTAKVNPKTLQQPQSNSKKRSRAQISDDDDSEVDEEEIEQPSKAKRQRTTPSRGGSRAKKIQQSESEDEDEEENGAESDSDKNEEDSDSDRGGGGGGRNSRNRRRDDDGPQVEKILGDKINQRTVSFRVVWFIDLIFVI